MKAKIKDTVLIIEGAQLGSYEIDLTFFRPSDTPAVMSVGRKWLRYNGDVVGKAINSRADDVELLWQPPVPEIKFVERKRLGPGDRLVTTLFIHRPKGFDSFWQRDSEVDTDAEDGLVLLPTGLYKEPVPLVVSAVLPNAVVTQAPVKMCGKNYYPHRAGTAAVVFTRTKTPGRFTYWWAAMVGLRSKRPQTPTPISNIYISEQARRVLDAALTGA